MSKKNAKKGFPPVIKASCGKEGCDLQPYVMPFAGTKEAFDKHTIEKFKPFKIAC
jgi:hypothetical protein